MDWTFLFYMGGLCVFVLLLIALLGFCDKMHRTESVTVYGVDGRPLYTVKHTKEVKYEGPDYYDEE